MRFDIAEIAGSCLLFCLVFGMSATVDIGAMKAQIRNIKAILTGVFLQFVILPLLGFTAVKLLNLDHAMGITLLVVTSSPGGSYSNWWCSMFNGDLALSVGMTAISTILSVIMLPANLVFYAKFSYEDDIVSNLDWSAIFISLAIVICAISLGLYASYKNNSHNFNIHANRLGNIAGISLVIFSAVVSSSGDAKLWDRDLSFFIGVAMPCLLGLLISNIITTGLRLLPPERVTVSIECCYQNTGIATSMALTMFQGNEVSEAMGVPFFYGIVEAVVLGIYCIVAWKCGWTKAPRNENICTVITTSYEVLYAEKAEKLLAAEEEQDSAVSASVTTVDVGKDFEYVKHEDMEEEDNPPSKKTSSVTFSASVPEPSGRRPNLRIHKKEPSYSLVRLSSDTNNFEQYMSRRSLAIPQTTIDESDL